MRSEHGHGEAAQRRPSPSSDRRLADDFAALGADLAPGEAFVDSLGLRLRREMRSVAATEAPPPPATGSWSPFAAWQGLWWWMATPSPARRGAFALAALVLALTVGLAASPATFAEAAREVRRIAGLGYEEGPRMPAPPAGQGACSPGPCRTVYRPLTADEAARYPFGLPRWAPEGFVLDGVSEDATAGAASFRWHNAAGQAIYLHTLPAAAIAPAARPVPIGPGGAQEIVIGGVPGALIGGMWNGQTGRWDQRSTHFRLNWVREGRFYGLDLHTDGCDAEAAACREGRGGRARLTVDDVIRMAESIP